MVAFKYTHLKHNEMPDFKNLPKGTVEVGFPKGTKSFVIKKAVWNEFGTELNDKQHIPPRPFFRNAMAQKTRISKVIERELKKSTARSYTDKVILGRVGLFVEGLIKDSITELRFPKNAPATVARKKSSNPLIQTGNMKQSVTHRVVT